MAASTAGRPPERGVATGSDGAWFLESASASAGKATHTRAARIARQIEADVIARGWPVGELLGSEQALQDRFGVSRAVLREAVRLVEHHQVARTRRGPNGGLFVTAPDALPATRALVVYLEYIGATFDDLLDARSLLDPLAAALAAEHIDEAGRRQLRGILDVENGHAAASSAVSDDLHLAVGALSCNPVVQLFVDVLSRLTGGCVDLSRIGATDVTSALLRRVRGDHRQLFEAVSAGDAEAARGIGQGHAESVIAWLHENHGPVGAKVAVSRPQGSDGHGKLAERVAAAIRADIVASGWRVGSVIGTEVQLLERYGVSRSTFREAVRLLEHHCVARMRRGPGGGLVVAAPEAKASVDTIALYLEYRRPTRADLTVVRDAIEVEHLTRVITRRDDVAVQCFLDTGRHAVTQAHGSDVGRAGVAEFGFHRALAELAGNRVLELFLGILVELFRRQWTSRGNAFAEGDDVTGVHRAHGRILDAIAAGDDALARQLMCRHLDALISWWF
ncbi:MAG: FadR/GntR family transcriptional regulator [Mycobacterium sp.]